MQEVRPPAVAGRFYPGQRLALAHEVQELLTEAHASAHYGTAPPKALIVPHAGYIYSGGTAASAYARLTPWRERIHRVVLLGPVHRVPVRGLALPQARALATPLGEVPIDAECVAAISGLPQVCVSAAAHAQEHSLEVQLPFLQTVLDRFSLVPLAVGDASADEVAEVLEMLWGGPETLIVISSDLSHYRPYRQAQAIDRATVDRILALGGPLTHEQACGATPANGLMRAARRHGLRPELIALCNSGDTAGDRDRVVGYAALAFADAPMQETSDDHH